MTNTALQVQHCRSCHARVIFARTHADHFMCLDAVPVADGNVEVIDGHARTLPRGELLQAHLAERPLFMSHHATCPDAKRWKRRR